MVDAIVKLLKAALLAIAAAAIVAVPAHAQIGALLIGPLNGSYCKIKKNDFIEVDSWLSLKYDEALVTKMTFKRLAELTRSKGFSVFVTEEFTCGTLLENEAPVGRRCKIRAKMENMAESPPELKAGQKRFVADEVMASTESDAASFPRFSGVMSSGNKCVVTPQP